MPPDELAPVVVLVHGMGTGRRGWAPQIEALSPNRRPKTPSMPGYDDEPGPFSIQAACDRVHQVIDAVPEGVPVAVCGLSLGALVALSAVCQNPARVSGLIAVAGFAYLPEEMCQQQLVMAEQIRSVPPDQFGAQVIAGLTQSVPSGHRVDATGALARFDPESMADLMVEAAHFDIRTDLANLPVPTLVAYGKGDEANRPLCEDLAARIKHAQIAPIPGAGHVANLDAPEQFNEALTSFLEQQDC